MVETNWAVEGWEINFILVTEVELHGYNSVNPPIWTHREPYTAAGTGLMRLIAWLTRRSLPSGTDYAEYSRIHRRRDSRPGVPSARRRPTTSASSTCARRGPSSARVLGHGYLSANPH